MNCVSPITLKSKGANLHRTNQVPCGKCVPCLERKRNDWSLRLSEEMRHCSSALFLTLTYNDENIPYNEDTGEAELKKCHLQLFLKQLRNFLSRGITTINFFGKSEKTAKNDVKLVYFAQGEYGTAKDRPHYHMILFNFPNHSHHLIEKAWNHGFVHFGEVNNATIHYATKYMITKYDQSFESRQKPFALMSKGIGLGYVKRNALYHQQNGVSSITQIGGVKYPLPRYFKDKIFDSSQKMEISAKNISYSKRQQEVNDLKIKKGLNSESEFIAVKHERIKSYLKTREKFLNKNSKL